MFVPRPPKRNKSKVSPSRNGVPVGPKIFQPTPTHEQISQRAYQIYRNAGCLDGRDQHDWFRAEQEMFSSASRAIGQP